MGKERIPVLKDKIPVLIATLEDPQPSVAADKRAIQPMADILAERFRKLGAKVTQHPLPDGGSPVVYAELPGATVETVNGCALHATAINKFEIAGVQSQRFTVLVVSDLPRAESLRLAGEVARQIA